MSITLIVTKEAKRYYSLGFEAVRDCLQSEGFKAEELEHFLIHYVDETKSHTYIFIHDRPTTGSSVPHHQGTNNLTERVEQYISRCGLPYTMITDSNSYTYLISVLRKDGYEIIRDLGARKFLWKKD